VQAEQELFARQVAQFGCNTLQVLQLPDDKYVPDEQLKQFVLLLQVKQDVIDVAQVWHAPPSK
jgi:hypothetical protein